MDRSTKRKIKNQQKKKKANLLASEEVPVKPEKKPEDFEERETEEADIKSDEPLNKKAKIGQNDESDSGNEEIGGNEEADIEIGQNGANNEPAEEFTKDTKVRLPYFQNCETTSDRPLFSGFSVLEISQCLSLIKTSCLQCLTKIRRFIF